MITKVKWIKRPWMQAVEKNTIPRQKCLNITHLFSTAFSTDFKPWFNQPYVVCNNILMSNLVCIALVKKADMKEYIQMYAYYFSPIQEFPH